MRAFLSINLTESICDAIQELQMELDATTSGIRWTAPHSCHITLNFLGDITPEQAQELQTRLHPVAEQMGPFPIELCGLGQFPPRGAASVVWIGITRGESSLVALERLTRKEIMEMGIKLIPGAIFHTSPLDAPVEISSPASRI